MSKKTAQISSRIAFGASIVLAIGCVVEVLQGLLTGRIPLGHTTYVDVAIHPIGYWTIICVESLLVALFIFGVVLSFRNRLARPSGKDAENWSSQDEGPAKGG